VEWKLARSVLKNLQLQKKKRPGCSLPAGSFLFGTRWLIGGGSMAGLSH
jgi:hypothetical protein